MYLALKRNQAREMHAKRKIPHFFGVFMIKRSSSRKDNTKSGSPSKRSRPSPESPVVREVGKGHSPASVPPEDELLTLVASYLSERGYVYVVGLCISDFG